MYTFLASLFVQLHILLDFNDLNLNFQEKTEILVISFNTFLSLRIAQALVPQVFGRFSYALFFTVYKLHSLERLLWQ